MTYPKDLFLKFLPMQVAEHFRELSLKCLLVLGIGLAFIGEVKSAAGDGCKKLPMDDVVYDMYLKYHSEANFTNVSVGQCSVNCFLSDTCQSINYNNKTKLCQTSTSTRFQHPIDFKEHVDNIYIGTKNACVVGSCPPPSVCKADFKNGGYTCDCPDGLSCSTTPTTTASEGSTTAATPASEGSTTAATPASEGSTTAATTASEGSTTAASPTTSLNSPSTEEPSSTTTSALTTTASAPCSSNPCQNGAACTESVWGYSCACPSGYTGANCETTLTSGVGCVLHFTTKSTSNYIQLDKPFRWFDEFSVSVWLKMDADDDIDPAMILSYATASNVEALSIGIKKDGVAEIKFAGAGASLSSGFTRDNTWQHLVFLYGNERFQVYKNKVLQEEKVVSGISSLRPDGSILVIGQHQGSVGRDFDPSKLFYGYMANLNIWTYDLDDWNRGKVYEQGCTGSVYSNPALSWGTITGKTLLGNIQPQCALTCP
ncbi:sushi, von Willebrand factor type A, EGF and pentraxin domain-containing protein 1 isoform X2 [Nematostella vectensis]|uniref:sushi, von Willebrand factor type A, EGF and pentraxin domain-containing protein 1 isoform X2 n=1 Tax=Nematostella vectensis TaxID=45351 RepID=UPI0020774247|nr:sushi, von Willebrand factor type A, EGF and pentraxin domain-containing protein 1 isoform X2 [Nematostella vectensis]